MPLTLTLTLAVTLTDEQLDELSKALTMRTIVRSQTRALPTGSRQDSQYLTAREAAAYLRCTRDRIYDLVQLGKLKPQRDGRRLLFQRDDLDAYLAPKPVESPPRRAPRARRTRSDVELLPIKGHPVE